MDYTEYKKIYNGLKTAADVNRLEAEGYDRRMLESLLTQKVSRDVKKRFHVVKKNAKYMLRDWKKGKTIMQIADRQRFPPILTAMMIFQEDGATKKQFWEFVRNPELLESEETARELREATENDLIYSPYGTAKQKERGVWGESLLEGWLDGQGISYRTENDLRGKFEKTPDSLLDEPMLYEGKKIFWIESKASFGDNVEFRYNSRKQLIPYTKIFGPGVVVYWVGCLNDLELPDGIYVDDISILDKKLKPI
ncbi:MAG: TPD domain-containing protein [Candidatus Methanomethylophilaceae archaeon]|jgi:hypothetical protein